MKAPMILYGMREQLRTVLPPHLDDYWNTNPTWFRHRGLAAKLRAMEKLLILTRVVDKIMN